MILITGADTTTYVAHCPYNAPGTTTAPRSRRSQWSPNSHPAEKQPPRAGGGTATPVIPACLGSRSRRRLSGGLRMQASRRPCAPSRGVVAPAQAGAWRHPSSQLVWDLVPRGSWRPAQTAEQEALRPQPRSSRPRAGGGVATPVIPACLGSRSRRRLSGRARFQTSWNDGVSRGDRVSLGGGADCISAAAPPQGSSRVADEGGRRCNLGRSRVQGRPPPLPTASPPKGGETVSEPVSRRLA